MAIEYDSVCGVYRSTKMTISLLARLLPERMTLLKAAKRISEYLPKPSGPLEIFIDNGSRGILLTHYDPVVNQFFEAIELEEMRLEAYELYFTTA